jgi:hypothetical protein
MDLRRVVLAVSLAQQVEAGMLVTYVNRPCESFLNMEMSI